MKKLLLISLLTIMNCNAMVTVEQQKENIIKALNTLNTSEKPAHFFAFYELFYYIKNSDTQPDEPIASIHKVILENLGLVGDGELKPMVKDVFMSYLKENGLEKTLLLDNDLE